MLIEVIILLLIVWMFIFTLNESQKPPGTPPGSVGLPIFGHLFRGQKPMTTYLNEFRKKYGDIFWIKMGSKKMVILSDPDLIKEAFSNPALNGRWKTYGTGLFRQGNSKNGLIFNDGTSWKNVRRFTLKHLRDGGMGKSVMEPIVSREAEALVENFGKHLGKPTLIPWSLNAAIFNVIWRIVADQRIEVDNQDLNILQKTLTDSSDASQGIWMAFNLLPWLDNVVPEFVKQHYLGKKKIDEQVKEMEKEMLKAVEEHRKALDEDNPKCIIDAYIIELNKIMQSTGNQSEEYSTFTEKELVYLVFDLFLAGSETTSSTSRWFLLFMVKNPKIQRTIQEEIDRVVPNDRMPGLSDRASLPHLDAAIHETMRCRTLFPIGLFHRALEDTTIGKYLIPKDTLVGSNLESVHTDPKLWERPHEFYPEHFLNPDKSFNTKRIGLLPFSIGKRVCLGEGLARMELYLLMSAVLQKYTFSIPEGEVINTNQRPDQPLISIPRNFRVVINKR